MTGEKIPNKISVKEYSVTGAKNTVCGAPLKIIGKEPVRTEVFFIPAQLKVV